MQGRIEHGRTERAAALKNHDETISFVTLCAVAASFIILGLFLQTPLDLGRGLVTIHSSTSQLISDYFQIGGPGAALVNSALVLLLELALIRMIGVEISGVLLACLLTTAGFAFFGTNLFNVVPIIAGVFLYGHIWQIPLSGLLPQAFLGTAISPIASFIAFGHQLPYAVSIPLGLLVGLLVGLIIPPLSASLLAFHQGYSLYNVGFTAGILALVLVSLLRLFHIEVGTLAIVYDGHSLQLSALLGVLFAAFLVIGLIKERFTFGGYAELLKSSGRLPSDFILRYGFGPTMINVGIMGMIGLGYVLVMGASVNGPIVGGLLTLAGFAAFGNHPKNSLPILIGTTFVQIVSPAEASGTSAMLASLFGTTLAPVAGTYGPLAGIAAGVIHAAVTANVIAGHGGINLYNNGLAGGFVAGVTVPLLDALKNLKRQGE